MREGWEKKNLKEVCKVFTDGNWIESKDQSSEGIRLVQTGNIGFGFFRNKEDKARFISEDTFKRLKCTEIIPGDLLVSRLPDPVGKSCIIPDLNTKMITGVDCTIIRPKEYLLSEYLGYFQMSNEYLKDVQSRVSGTTRSRISRKNLGIIKIPIPPLQEQKQIVAILDKAFTAINQAKANIEKNIDNAKELFQSKLNKTFDRFNESSDSKKLGNILEVLTDYHANGSYKVLKENVELKDEEDYAWMVRSTDFEKGFKKNFKYIDEHAYNHLKKSKIFGGEIIISKIGNAGKVYVMPEINRPCSLAMNLFLLRLKKEEMGSEYLYYYLQSTKGEKQILSKLNGTATKTITKDSVRDLNIPFVEVDLQNKTINEFKKLKDKVINLEASYNIKLKEIEELKKSILQKAFAGELTNKTVVV